MPKYIVEWSETDYYKVEVEAENQDEALKNAMLHSTDKDIISHDCQLEYLGEKTVEVTNGNNN